MALVPKGITKTFVEALQRGLGKPKTFTEPLVRRRMLEWAAQDVGNRFQDVSKQLGKMSADEHGVFTNAVRRAKTVKPELPEQEFNIITHPYLRKSEIELPKGSLPLVENLEFTAQDFIPTDWAAREAGKIPQVDADLLISKTGRVFIGKSQPKAAKLRRRKDLANVRKEVAELSVEHLLDVDPMAKGATALERVYDSLKRGRYLPIIEDITVDQVPDRVSSGIREFVGGFGTFRKRADKLREKYFRMGALNEARAHGSPHYLARDMYTELDNPVVDAADVYRMWLINTSRHMIHANKVLDISKLGRSVLVPNKRGPIARAARELFARDEKLVKAYQRHIKWEYQRQELLDARSKLLAKKNFNPKDHQEIQDALLVKESQIFENGANWIPQWEGLMQYMSELYADARIYLGSMFPIKTRPSFIVPLSDAEEQAAVRMRRYFDTVGYEMERAGITVLPGSSIAEYVPFTVTYKYLARTRKEKLMQPVSRVSPYSKEHMPEIINLARRGSGTVPWIPSIRATIQDYIPNVNRALAFTPFARKWNRYRNYLDSAAHTSGAAYREAKWWDAWYKDQYVRHVNTTSDKLLKLFYFWEANRLLAFVLSAGAKHLTKAVGTGSEIGYMNMLRAQPQNAKALVGWAANKGLLPKKYFRSSIETFMVAQRIISIRQIMVDLEAMPGVWNMLGGITRLTSLPITLAELFDRGSTIYGTIALGARAGASLYTTKRLIWEKTLSTNFLGGFDQLRFMRSQARRAMLLFATTSTKVFERPATLFLESGREMKALKDALMEFGVAGWKHGRYERDLAGSTATARIIRYLIALGALEYVSEKLFGTSFFWYSQHPIIGRESRTGHAVPIQLPPVVMVLAEMQMQGSSLGQALKHQLATITMADKINRMLEKDIPSVYWDKSQSKLEAELRYLLTAPKTESKLNAQEWAALMLMLREISDIRYKPLLVRGIEKAEQFSKKQFEKLFFGATDDVAREPMDQTTTEGVY